MLVTEVSQKTMNIK